MESLPARSPNVRLHISIKDKKPSGYTEVLRGTSKGYETVEVDGLVFRRKRQESIDCSKAAKKLRASEPEEEAEFAPAAMSSGPQTQGNTPSHQTLQPSTTAESPGVEASDELEASRQSALQAQEDPAQTPTDVEAVAIAMLEQLPQDYSEAEKLLSACDLLALAFGGNGPTAFVTSFKSRVAEALQDGTLMCKSPPALDLSQARLADERAQRLIALQKQVAALQQEEAEWMAVLREGEELAASTGEPAEKPSLEANTAEIQPRLKKAHKESHSALSFQVEGLSMMMANVEQLVNKAENQCRLMQVAYHKEKFLKFPHVNSPARLIHEIVQDRRF